jgi:UDP-N-acetyl-D-glucosamine dehydrogenase
VKVSIIGQGYVGLPLSMAMVHAGHEVTGIDLNSSLITKIRSRTSPIQDVTNQDIEKALDSSNYNATSNFESISSSQVVVICVPTPLDKKRNPDFSFLIAAAESIRAH